MFMLALVLAGVAVMQAAAQQATVELTPASYTVPNVGLAFNVNVTVGDVENLYGYEFKLFYSKDILNGTSVTEGSFLKTGGVSTFFFVANFTDNYNATHGYVHVSATRMGNVSGANGTGTLATVSFKSVSTDGPRILHLADVKLSDPDSTAIPFAAVDGEVTVLPEFPAALIPALLAALSLVAVGLSRKTGE